MGKGNGEGEGRRKHGQGRKTRGIAPWLLGIDPLHIFIKQRILLSASLPVFSNK